MRILWYNDCMTDNAKEKLTYGIIITIIVVLGTLSQISYTGPEADKFFERHPVIRTIYNIFGFMNRAADMGR